MQRIGIIDLGSNAARLVIVRIYKNNSTQMIYNHRISLRLGQRINKNGEITKDAVKDTVDAVKKFSHMCELFKTQTILAVATAAMRSAKNGPEIVSMIKEETGIEVKIITGEEEANYGYIGVINSLDFKNAVLFDLGGGSLEVVIIKDRQPEHLASINIGTTTMTEKFKTADKMSNKSFRELSTYVEEKIKEALPWLESCNLPVIGIGGTVRNIAKMHQRKIQYVYPKLHNYQMKMPDFSEVFNLLRAATCEERRGLPGLSLERADIILAGATVINTIFTIVKNKDFIVSGCGLREGIFYEYNLSRLGFPKVIANIREASMKNLLALTVGNDTHSQKVAYMAEKMFTAWQPLHKLMDDEFKILHVAATLHDIGISINYYAHPRHSAYLIENAPLKGLTHKEQVMAALVAQWHNGASLKNLRNKLYKDFLSEKDVIIARKLSILLAMAENLDFTETDAIKDIYPDILSDGRAVLGIASDDTHGIELGELRTNLSWFKKEFKTELVLREI